jgi:hypothetical protein
MKRVALKNAIDQAYNSLEAAAIRDGVANELLAKAHEAAESSERSHRRIRFGSTSFRDAHNDSFSVAYAAKYFVLKWTHAATARPKGWLEIATTRLDCVYASGLQERLSELKSLPAKPAWLDSVDYARDIVGPAE